VRHEQIRQQVDHVRGLELASHPDSQALVGELIDDVEHPELAPVMGPVFDEVIRPDVVGMLGPQTDAGPISQPEPSLLGLLGWHLEPLSSPDPLDALGVHRPARGAQESGDLAVAVAPILPRQRDDVGRERLLVVPPPRHLALRRAMLTERPTGAALGNGQRQLDVLDTDTPARGA